MVGVLCLHALSLSGHPRWMRGRTLGASVCVTLPRFLIPTLLPIPPRSFFVSLAGRYTGGRLDDGP